MWDVAMSDLDWRGLGLKGATLRETGMPTVEEILCGYMNTGDPRYAMRTLVEHYQRSLDMLPIKVGDVVRVRRRYWCLGDQNNGWNGYAAMFADEKATVTKVSWNSWIKDWNFDATYANPYRWSDYRQDFDVKDGARTFFFKKEHLKVVKSKKPKKESPCGDR